jgi:hypothetical protein
MVPAPGRVQFLLVVAVPKVIVEAVNVDSKVAVIVALQQIAAPHHSSHPIAAHQLQQPWWVLLLEACLARALLFDPSLSLSQSWFNHREGRSAESLFKVGTIAAGDRATRWADDKLSMEPEHLRFLLWVVCIVLAHSSLVPYQVTPQT